MRALWIGVVVGSVVAGWATPAGACIPAGGVTSRVLPAFDTEAPGNAVFVYKSRCVHGEAAYEVTVDGVPSAIEDAGLELGENQSAFRLASPAPPEPVSLSPPRLPQPPSPGSPTSVRRPIPSSSWPAHRTARPRQRRGSTSRRRPKRALRWRSAAGQV